PNRTVFSRFRRAQIFHRGLRFYGVALQNNLAGLRFNPDTDGLLPGPRRPGVANDVVAENQVPGFAAHPNAGDTILQAVVLDDVVLKTVAVSSHARAFIAEKNAVLPIREDLILLQNIVRVFVSDGDAEPAVVLENVSFKQTVLHAPAQIQSVFAVAACDTFPDDGSLRAAAGMETQSRIVLADAVLNDHVVRLLKADSVAVIILHHAILNDGAEAPVKKYAAATASVEIDILILVPINDQVFHANTLDIVAADNRKNGRGLRLVGHHAIGV